MTKNTSSNPKQIDIHLIHFGTPEKREKMIQGGFHKVNNEASPKSRILIVEDEALVAENEREFLEGSGYLVTKIVYSGEEALEFISSKEVDLILMDIRLAGKMNGIETAILIHQIVEKLPIVFLTAYAEELHPEIGNLSPEFYRFLTKPYSASDLKNAIQELLA